ncbi:PIR protein [Plasmodium vivax]|uniref:VIR protein n=1 Tax=Plasmodium vivax TaxID=5855 RepID=A0A565A546_PLAVI|nr:PIR protein [Plasmodium vivax]
MSSNDDAHTLDKIKDEVQIYFSLYSLFIYAFISSSDPYYIYKELNESCRKIMNNCACYDESVDGWEQKSEIKVVLKNLYSSIYKIASTTKGDTNDYYDDRKHEEIKKMGLMYLKYWLYDQMLKNKFDDSSIKSIFHGFQMYLKPKIDKIYKDFFKINELTLSEIKRIKKVYALYTIFYDNNNNWGPCSSDQCKYMDYFGEGLDELINSINKCSIEESMSNYCNELEEFLSICKDDKLNAGITVHEESTKNAAHDAGKYLLFSEKYKKTQLYIYLKNEELINFVKTSHFISSKYRATIAATSVVGSAIGLSSIFYYFYKQTRRTKFNCSACVGLGGVFSRFGAPLDWCSHEETF